MDKQYENLETMSVEELKKLMAQEKLELQELRAKNRTQEGLSEQEQEHYNELITETAQQSEKMGEIGLGITNALSKYNMATREFTENPRDVAEEVYVLTNGLDMDFVHEALADMPDATREDGSITLSGKVQEIKFSTNTYRAMVKDPELEKLFRDIEDKAKENAERYKTVDEEIEVAEPGFQEILASLSAQGIVLDTNNEEMAKQLEAEKQRLMELEREAERRRQEEEAERLRREAEERGETIDPMEMLTMNIVKGTMTVGAISLVAQEINEKYQNMGRDLSSDITHDIYNSFALENVGNYITVDTMKDEMTAIMRNPEINTESLETISESTEETVEKLNQLAAKARADASVSFEIGDDGHVILKNIEVVAAPVAGTPDIGADIKDALESAVEQVNDAIENAKQEVHEKVALEPEVVAPHSDAAVVKEELAEPAEPAEKTEKAAPSKRFSTGRDFGD